MKRIVQALLTFVGAAVASVAIAGSAQAADVGTVTFAYDSNTHVYGVTPASVTGAVGDTFTLVNAASLAVGISGPVSLSNGTSCVTGSNCNLSGNSQVVLTILGGGSVALIDNGVITAATFTVQVRSGAVTQPSYQFTYWLPDGTQCGPLTQTVVNGTTVSLPSTDANCTQSGYRIAGWAVPGNATTLAPGAQVTVAGNQQFTAALVPTACTTGVTVNVSMSKANSAQVQPTTSLMSGAAVGVMPYVLVPYQGTVTELATGSYQSNGNGAAGGQYAVYTPFTCSGNGMVSISAPAGVHLLSQSTAPSAANPVAWNAGSNALSVASGTPVFIFSEKIGVQDITFASGSSTVTAKIKAATVPQAAYNIALNPEKQDLITGAFGTATVSVTDFFGNPVQTVADAGQVTVSISGQALFAGYVSTISVNTDAAGRAIVTLIAGNAAGSSSITAAPSPLSAKPTIAPAAAFGSGYTRPSSFPAPRTAATATVNVTPVITKSIVIVGERTTVSGKSGIRIDGVTEGFAEGDIVNPYVKLAGQTEYTMGVDKTIDAAGEFSWQRKTGKKAYVYFKSADGSVKSNTVIIPTV